MAVLNLKYYVILMMLIGINCSLGSRTDACKADLKRGYSAGFCDVLPFAMFANNDSGSISNGIEGLLLGCIIYQEKLKECEKEGNQFTPALYSKE
ncbi:hypothetical protein [Leptospira kmetyi]|uniref:Lipoprotein n=1 Tax=Leptospira kmetyi TaxID=408139 RepID=A0ABX4N7Z6_9LEPT|nr:hypothetical protein [Leptospira kmetyi]PJZ29481.1 hypothetical protein CH378_12385 [Leptospira kmetyi]